jgi:lytic murein transglycosylase
MKQGSSVLFLMLMLSAISGCTTSTSIAATKPISQADPRDAELQQCLADLRSEAMQGKISHDNWQRYTHSIAGDYSVLERLNHQPEFKTPLWDYMAGLVDDERVDMAKQQLAANLDLLTRIEQTYGVPKEIIVSVWGVESNFGRNMGRTDIVPSLATLSCFGRRQPFFRGELFATLRILQSGDIPLERLKGSWAGAFGQTQFMPSTYERLAVDFDGDGRRDLIDSTADALSSTANFLKRGGWRTGQPWGVEAGIPSTLDISAEGRRSKRSLAEWHSLGVVSADGRSLTDALNLAADTQAGLISPTGKEGPVFITLRNFDALYGYNAAESYALALAHLADRMQGAGGFITPWPTDDPPLSRQQRRDLQTLLLARGHAIGEVDGILGTLSRAAIRQEQQRLGHEPTGRGGMKLLTALQADSSL